MRQLFDEGSVPQAAKFGLPEAQFMIAYNNFHGECDSELKHQPKLAGLGFFSALWELAITTRTLTSGTSGRMHRAAPIP